MARSLGSPFDVLDDAFKLLVTPPAPLSLPVEGLPGVADGEVALDRLQSRLLHPSVSYATRDRLLSDLVARAQAERGPWLLGLGGVLSPGLRRALFPLARACPPKREDLEAEMLAGLIEAVDTFGVPGERVASRLIWAATRRAHRLLRAELAEVAHTCATPEGCEPRRPFGHPDLVLADAVAAGVIAADDAELISETRLGERCLADVADRTGLSYAALRQRRLRAERRLVAWLRRDVFVAPKVPVHVLGGAGRPRAGGAGQPLVAPWPTTKGGDRPSAGSPARDIHPSVRKVRL